MPSGIYIRTEAHNNAISKSHMGEKNYFFGKHHSEITKRKIRKKLKGRKLSEKTKKNMSKALEGNKRRLGIISSEDAKRKISKSQKRYIENLSKEEKIIRIKNWQEAALKANPSSIEKAICKVLYSLNIKYETQIRIGKWFVDIFIPEKNIVIECNGNYWHNYKIFPEKEIRDKELQKYCFKNGYKLIWLWEDEIRKNANQLIKFRLRSSNEKINMY